MNAFIIPFFGHIAALRSVRLALHPENLNF